MSALQCRELVAGHVTARPVVHGVDLTLDPGEITCLLGPNGAGKTTTLMTLSGLLPRRGGTVTVDGVDIPSGDPRAAVRAGLVLVPDDRALFRQLSVADNLRLAIAERSRRSTGLDEVLNYFPALEKRLRIDAGRLSGGEQQMLAIGRAIVQRPKVLLVDELSMGLAPVIVDEILAVLSRLAGEENLAVLLVEQHVHLALAAATSAVIIAHGHVVDEGPAAELAGDPDRIERAYLGESAQVVA